MALPLTGWPCADHLTPSFPPARNNCACFPWQLERESHTERVQHLAQRARGSALCRFHHWPLSASSPLLLPLTPHPSHTCCTNHIFPGQTFKYFSLGNWALKIHKTPLEPHERAWIEGGDFRNSDLLSSHAVPLCQPHEAKAC